MAREKEIENKVVCQIQKHILEGHDSNDIREFIEKEYPGLETDVLYKKAIIGFAEHGLINHEVKHGFAVAATQELYRKMLEVGDFAGALSAIKEFSKLNNLYEKRKRKKEKSADALETKDDLILTKMDL